MSAITHLAFVTKVVIPGTGERQDEFSRQHHWVCELQPDGSVRISNSAATSRAPFTVVGVGYSYRTEADVSVKAARAAKAAA